MKKEGVAFLFVIFFVIFFVGGCKAGTTETPFPDTKNIPDPVSVAIISAPSNAFVGEAIPISWGVEGVEKTITHTAIHYDYEPHADKLFRYVTMTEGEKEYPHFTK
ncbi:MAG: hypothetical protein QXR60_02475, partial [Candidatus Nanoarchaeia archaeon]